MRLKFGDQCISWFDWLLAPAVLDIHVSSSVCSVYALISKATDPIHPWAPFLTYLARQMQTTLRYLGLEFQLRL